MFTKIATQDQLPGLDQAKEFSCGEKAVCIANVNGQFSAMNNVCVHEGGPLGEGVIEDGKVICPWHGWAYDPKTGESHPGAKVEVYPLKIENGDVMVDV
jgi:nitrite reductase (NADH) small subunit